VQDWPPQQAWPSAPHTQLPLPQDRLTAQVPPAQHGRPAVVPQATHWRWLLHTALLAHMLPQQGCPTAPQEPQVWLALQARPLTQGGPLVQQGSPASPQSHIAFTQIPPGQGPVMGTVVHVPLAQPSCVHGFPSSQVAHDTPPAPQAMTSVPGWQRMPSKQPRQHCPPRQVPP